MEELNKIGQLVFKDFKPLKDLELNKRYKIDKIEKIKDKYGPTVIVELEECKVHLPQRFLNIMDDKMIRDLNKKDINLIITEIKTFKEKETCLLKFE